MSKIFLILLLALPISSFAEVCTSRNHVYLIHGIGGDNKAFGVMDQYLEKINPCVEVSGFEYATGKNAEVSTYDFAEDLDNFIETKNKENNFSENDKVSLIMHSQGGVVGSIWVHKVKHEKPELYSKIDSFITLSTPYWGSTMAIIGKKFFFTSPSGTHNPLSPFGRTELRDMSYGSVIIKTMQENSDDIFTGSHIRFLAIGGLKRDYNAEYGEDDTTVSVYSSNPDHYALMEKIDLSVDSTQTTSMFRVSDSVPFIPVTATHFQLEIPGVAKIDKKCMKKDVCSHPSIEHVIRHLNGEAPMTDNPAFTFRKYRAQVWLTGWEGMITNNDEVKLSIVKPHGEIEDIDFEIKRGGILNATFSGILRSTEEESMSIKLMIKGKVVREYTAPVKGGYSTFLNLELKQ